MNNPKWLVVAERELGVRKFSKGSSNPRITEYHQGTNIAGYDDKVAWCSSFLDWVFREVGLQGTGSALARSWLSWGERLSEPKLGCVVILQREDPKGWQGHVGLFLKIQDDKIFLLGGNQLDAVCQHHYPLSSVIDYRWPTNVVARRNP